MADNKRIIGAMLAHIDNAHKLSDGELIDAVVNEVWANLSLKNRDNALLSEMIERFQKLSGVEETPSGVTVDGEPLWPDVVSEEE